MVTPVAIHRLSPENAHLLERVTDDVFDHDVRSDSLLAFLDCPRHELFFAETEGKVVGICSSFEYVHPDKRPQMFINEVGVDEGYRRRGIGRMLLEAMLRHAQSKGLACAWLGTASDNLPAQALFGAALDPEDRPQPFLLYEWDWED